MQRLDLLHALTYVATGTVRSPHTKFYKPVHGLCCVLVYMHCVWHHKLRAGRLSSHLMRRKTCNEMTCTTKWHAHKGASIPVHLPDFALFLPSFVCCSVFWQELLEVMHQLRMALQQLSHLQQQPPMCKHILHIASDCMSSCLAMRHNMTARCCLSLPRQSQAVTSRL